MTKKNHKKRVTFQYCAPEARNISLVGNFNSWDIFSHPFKQSQNGEGNVRWQKIIYLEPGVYEYRFVVDGCWQNDPQCEEKRANEFGDENCVLRV